MTEENKKKQEAAEGNAQIPAPEKTEPPVPEKTEPPAAEKPETPAPEKKEEAKREKPSNCAACNKSIRKKRWYYRDGKFYCSKRCWHTTAKKKDQAQEAPQEEKK